MTKQKYNENDVFVAKSIQLMLFLVREGFDVVKVRDSDYNKEMKSFYFKYTPELKKLADNFIHTQLEKR